MFLVVFGHIPMHLAGETATCSDHLVVQLSGHRPRRSQRTACGLCCGRERNEVVGEQAAGPHFVVGESSRKDLILVLFFVCESEYVNDYWNDCWDNYDH